MAKDFKNIKQTHFFNHRFENVYLSEQQVPKLSTLKREAKQRAGKILSKPIRKMGCWFNAMEPGSGTSLHRHDDDDEQLSGVYYVSVAPQCGELIVHSTTQEIRHTPQAGQWAFFSPQIPHEVSENRSDELRLSIAFNFA